MRPICILVAVLFAVILVVACTGSTVVTPTPTSPPDASSPGTPAPPTAPAVPSPPSSPAPAPSGTPSASAAATSEATSAAFTYEYEEFDVPAGSHPHDIAPDPDAGGFVWYTAQNVAKVGRLDPTTAEVVEVDMPSAGSAPHGSVVGPDGSVWVTDQGANTIERIDPVTLAVTTYEMPADRFAGPHTPAIDNEGLVWFTGSAGYIGRLDPASGVVDLFPAPEGPGPYGIDVTPAGHVWYVNLDASYLALIDRVTGESTVYEPRTPEQGARRVWSDSTGRLWVSEWNTGQLSRYDPASGEWREWLLPGPNPMAYAVYVDELDHVWITDFGSNSIVKFDPATEQFEAFVLPTAGAQVRQLLGREGELWGAESATDKLVVLRRIGG